MRLGGQDDGSDLTSSSQFKVRVDEMDLLRPGITIPAEYSIKWHLPRDNWKSYGSEPTFWDYPIIEIGDPGYATIGVGVNVSYVINDNYWGGAIDEIWGALSAVLGNSVPPPYGSFIATLGLINSGSRPVTVPVSFNDNWGSSTSTYLPSRDDSLKNRYHMVPEKRVGYKIKFWDGEIYGAHGYEGQDKKAVASLDTREEWITTFELQNPTVIPPSVRP